MLARLLPARFGAVISLGALLGALACSVAHAVDPVPPQPAKSDSVVAQPAKAAPATAASATATAPATAPAPAKAPAPAAATPKSAFADTRKPVTFLKETVVTGAR